MMDAAESELLELAKRLAVHIPEMVALLLGIVLSLANWSKYPRPALLSFLGFVILLALSIALEIVFFFVPQHINTGLDPEVFDLVAMGTMSFLTAGAYLLLMFAVHAGRKPRAPLPPWQ